MASDRSKESTLSLKVPYAPGDGLSMYDGVAGILLLAADMGDEQRVQSSIAKYEVFIDRWGDAGLISSLVLNKEWSLSSGLTGVEKGSQEKSGRGELRSSKENVLRSYDMN